VAALSLEAVGGWRVSSACDGASGVVMARAERPDAISRVDPSAPSRPAHAWPVAAPAVGAMRWHSPVTVAGPRRIRTGLPFTTDQ